MGKAGEVYKLIDPLREEEAAGEGTVAKLDQPIVLGRIYLFLMLLAERAFIRGVS